MKALRKQLAAAIVMTLVAAIALGSSTYAWFATNNSAEAKGMNVQASTDSGLLIGAWRYESGKVIPTKPNDDQFTSSETARMNSDTTFFPTSIAPYASPSTPAKKTWYWAVSGSRASYNNAIEKYVKIETNENATTPTDDEKDALIEAESYRSWNRFTVKPLASTVEKVWLKSLKVTGRTGTNQFDKALRVALEMDGTLYTFAPYQATTTNLEYVYATPSTSHKKYGSSDKIYAGMSDTTNNLCNIPSTPVLTNVPTTGSTINVYIYFEGEDPDCTTNMAIYGTNVVDSDTTKIKADKLGVSFELTTEDPAEAGKTPKP